MPKNDAFNALIGTVIHLKSSEESEIDVTNNIPKDNQSDIDSNPFSLVESISRNSNKEKITGHTEPRHQKSTTISPQKITPIPRSGEYSELDRIINSNKKPIKQTESNSSGIQENSELDRIIDAHKKTINTLQYIAKDLVDKANKHESVIDAKKTATEFIRECDVYVQKTAKEVTNYLEDYKSVDLSKWSTEKYDEICETVNYKFNDYAEAISNKISKFKEFPSKKTEPSSLQKADGAFSRFVVDFYTAEKSSEYDIPRPRTEHEINDPNPTIDDLLISMTRRESKAKTSEVEKEDKNSENIDT